MMIEDIESYLAVRRAAGYKLKRLERLLRDFARFSSEQGKEHICSKTAIEWASRVPSLEYRSSRLKKIVHFARYIKLEDNRHEIPPDDVFIGYHSQRRSPFIFTTDDINRLIKEALRLGPPGSLRPHTYSTLFALLAVTGLRISEALALRLQDVTTDGLVIRKTKFDKSRLVPLHESTKNGLERYLIRRCKVAGGNDHVFVSIRGTPLHYVTAQQIFQYLVHAIGLHSRPGQPHPRIHDLRHSFATRAIEMCSEGRDGIARHMVALSTYLGHTNIKSTYWYLEATPQLLKDISKTCELFTQGGE